MARPRKQTVDYFPHSCNHGQTIFILEQKYQQIGYTFWFKLLEELGKREGHYVDCRNPSTLEFLQAKTFTDEKTCLEMLDLLSKLEAIDPELWQEKVIWCQKFVDGIADVYKNRRVDIPTRPSFYRQKPMRAPVSTDSNPQTKLKETKGKEMKENETKLERVEEKQDTPSQEAKNFFSDISSQEEIISYLEEKNVPRQMAIQEVNKFVSYWTEPNKTGTKERWELEKTFEVRRRLVTWFRNIKSFNSQETKGITL